MNGTRSDTADAAITTTVSALSDDRLLEQTKELSGIEHHLEVVVIDHLREILKRRLYLRRGFSSLFDYAVADRLRRSTSSVAATWSARPWTWTRSGRRSRSGRGAALQTRSCRGRGAVRSGSGRVRRRGSGVDGGCGAIRLW